MTICNCIVKSSNMWIILEWDLNHLKLCNNYLPAGGQQNGTWAVNAEHFYLFKIIPLEIFCLYTKITLAFGIL
jgi:hypothetical protein